MNLDRNFRVDRPFNMLNKVVINDLPDKISKKYILHLFKLFLDYDIYYLAQTELSLINKNLQGFFETDEIDSTLKNILLNKTMFFEHISQWKRFCQNLSFSIGTRFHGNMFAMQVGVPSVWLSHDSRTIELLEFVKLPYIIVMKKVLDMSLNDIMEVCFYDNFNSNYQYLYNNYVSFLDKNNLQHVLK